ncbi:hypothetical protein R3P38DRAFT_2829386 [Favolaschia claudopus]|uniref:BOD1/SHG1 domain-containing protein n=1 Tax=Favolaschia claudopus TaxID=2862362 RepID=A0AAW0E7N1_9AGAR
MPISEPRDLVAQFKTSGEFDKLRRQLLADAQRSSGFEAFKARVEEIARERLESGQTAYTAPELLHKDLMQEINRFPIVDRFASDVPMLSDNIRASLQRTLREDRGQKDPPPENAAPSQPSGESARPSPKEDPSLLPSQEPALAPLVPPGPSSEVPEKEMDVDTLDSAPLTDPHETVASSPKSSPLSSPPGPS